MLNTLQSRLFKLDFANHQFAPVKLMVILSAGFFGLSCLYCYFYAAFFPNPSYQAKVASVMQCVSKDWLLWTFASPLLCLICMGRDLSTRNGLRKLVAAVIATTLLLGAVRVSVEFIWGNDQLLHTFIIYLPRYLFITALMLAIALLLEKQFYQAPSPQTDLKHLPSSPQRQLSAKIPVMKGNATKLLELQSILYFRACGNYLDVQTKEGCYLQRNTLKRLEEELSGQGFVRIHRSYLVNENVIDSVCFANNTLNLMDQTTLPIGKTYQVSLPHTAEKRRWG